MIAGSTSKWARLIEGTPYWRESRLVISSSLHEAEGDEGLAELAAAHLLVIERFLELLRSHHVLLQQQLSEFDWHPLAQLKKARPYSYLVTGC